MFVHPFPSVTVTEYVPLDVKLLVALVVDEPPFHE